MCHTDRPDEGPHASVHRPPCCSVPDSLRVAGRRGTATLVIPPDSPRWEFEGEARVRVKLIVGDSKSKRGILKFNRVRIQWRFQKSEL